MSTSECDPNHSEDLTNSQVIGDESRTSSESLGPCCDKCGAVLNAKESLVCKKCGWYASIGSYVELDQSWEQAVEPDPEIPNPEAEERPSGIFQALPKWAWILLACICTIIVESIVARIVTPYGSTARTVWSLTQLGLGACAYGFCHCFAFAILLREDSDTSLIDIILRPIKIWAGIFRELPNRQWVCHVGFSGLIAAMMSVLVIGGIPYEKLFDWGFEPPPEQNLMGAIMSQAQKAAGDSNKNMQEALNDFAGTAEDLTNGGKNKPAPREKAEGVIVGYKANEDGIVYALLIAAEHKGKLMYVGRVTPNMPEEELNQFSQDLASIRVKRPFIETGMKANWVSPKYLCRVNYKSRNKKGAMEDLTFEELAGRVKLPGI